MTKQNSFKLDSIKLKAAIPFFILAAVFLFVWTEQDVDIRDPWYVAVQKVDSSSRISDPIEKKKLLEEGGSELKTLLKKYPYHARLYYFIAVYYVNSNQHDKAIEACIKTIELGKGAIVNQVDILGEQLLSKIAINRSNFHIQKKEFKKSGSLLHLGLFYSPKDANLLNHMAYNYQVQNNIDSTIYYYKKTIQVNPNYQRARKNLSNIYSQMAQYEVNKKKYKEAEDLFRQAQALLPKSAVVNNNLGQILFQNGKVEESINFFQLAVNSKPNEKTFKRNLKRAKKRLRNGK